MTDDARNVQTPNLETPSPTVAPKSPAVEAARTAVPTSEPPAPASANGAKSAVPVSAPATPAPAPVSGAASAVASPVPPTVLPISEKDKLPETGDLSALRSTRQLSDITNNKCPTCGLVNRVGVLVCENCGTSLLSGAASVPSTRSLQDQSIGTGQLSSGRLPDIDRLPLTTPRVESMSILETAQSGITEDTILKLEISGATQPLMVLPKREVMVGRKDLTTGTLPDLDLTPFAGYRMGVSRRHAVFRMYDRRIEVVDLGSSNGSRLNGILLHAHQPYLLRDGDLLTFGKMEMRVSFHHPPPRISRL